MRVCLGQLLVSHIVAPCLKGLRSEPGGQNRVLSSMDTKTPDQPSLRPCRLQDIESVLELWRQADAIPSLTDNAEDLRRAINASAAYAVVAEKGGQIK
jgi:hypothetical protein